MTSSGPGWRKARTVFGDATPTRTGRSARYKLPPRTMNLSQWTLSEAKNATLVANTAQATTDKVRRDRVASFRFLEHIPKNPPIPSRLLADVSVCGIMER